MATLTVTSGLSPSFASGDTVTPDKLNLLGAPTVALTAGTIVAADIASDAVTTAKILDANVTTAKLADSAVTTAKVNDSAVTTAKINNAAITAAKLDGAQTGSAPIYGCRAWVNFDGTTTPPSIRASGNVTNVTKNATGDYTINFTTAMSDANYSAVSSVGAASSTNATLICAKYAGTSTSASFRIQSTANTSTSTYYDLADISVQIFR